MLFMEGLMALIEYVMVLFMHKINYLIHIYLRVQVCNRFQYFLVIFTIKIGSLNCFYYHLHRSQ